MSESKNRQEQKRLSRLRNNKSTMQIRVGLKEQLQRIKERLGYNSLDEALDHILSEYEDNHNAK